MQILTSGSFINIDSGEKIEQLIFTAKAIADSAVQTDGFVSDEENNKRLALEIWQGAEYMTREHEQARIQNLFVNNFLERLREIGATSATKANGLSESSESLTVETSPVEADVQKDEFLGFVNTTTENENQETVETEGVITENADATKPFEISSQIDGIAGSVRAENLETESVESAESPTAETPEVEIVEPEIVESFESNQETENKIADVSESEKNEKPAIGAIALPEKEPYRWDDCTVTATIQLLPVETGMRRAVLSVRTHDFAPQISVVELSGAAATPENIAPALEKAFARYKTDLPVKVMDKMKREKSSGKKHQSKTTVANKTDSPISNQVAENQSKSKAQSSQTSVAKSESNQAAPRAASQTVSAQTQSNVSSGSKPSVKTSKPESNAQGNLFGF